jgi:hypothetical protein
VHAAGFSVCLHLHSIRMRNFTATCKCRLIRTQSHPNKCELRSLGSSRLVTSLLQPYITHNATTDDYAMASNEAPNSPSQQQSVLQQLWEQQSAQYYWYWRPGLVSQTPARNMHAQQPNLAYPSPTHNGNQPIPPILRSAQYEGGSDQTYATQVMLVCPFSSIYYH